MFLPAQTPPPSGKQSCPTSPPPRSGPAARSAPWGSHRGLLKSKKQSYTSHPSPPETMEGEKLRHLLKIPFLLYIIFIIVTFRILVVIPGNPALLQSLHSPWHITLELSENILIICNWIKLISTNAFLAAFLHLWKAQFLCKMPTREHNVSHCELWAFFLTGEFYIFESWRS